MSDRARNAAGRGLQTHAYLRERYDRVGLQSRFRGRTPAELRAWGRKTAILLKRLTGYDTMLKTALRPRVTETVDQGDWLRQRVEFLTEPGILLCAYVLVPKKAKPPFPAVIAPHGHASGGKLSVAGCREIPEIAEAIRTYNYDYGVQFVREGFLVLCPDARGFGERREAAAMGSLLNSSCQWINNMAIPLGQTVTGMWAWDLHRAVDYLQGRPDCMPDRIGCAGLSGGGLQTLWAAALDPRIRCAVVSGYLYGYKKSLLDQHTNCACNYVPHLYEHVDMGDIAALIAPRPLLVETGDQDTLNGSKGLGNVLSQMRIIRKAYAALGAGAKLRHDVFEGGHRWNGVKAIPWMKAHLMAGNR